MNWLESRMADLYNAMGGEQYEGGTSAHLASVQASHDWNMRYGRGDLTDEQYADYYLFSENTASEMINAGQNESKDAVTRYWTLMESYLAPISSRTAAAAGAGVDAAQAIQDGPLGDTSQAKFPWWLLAGGAALLLWRK